MTAYYNEIDPYAAEWLRRLIAAGHIAPGVVDTRSITELDPDELRTYTQCHFFAGIGVWSHALRSAGWDDARPVWTGSCPCQPFSSAGKRLGTADERHLWPAFARLIAECKPPAVFGEQVASGAGRDWLASVRADLEALGYAVGAADLCAAGTGAPHIRQRLYWVADASGQRVRVEGCGPDAGTPRGVQGERLQRQRLRPDAGNDGSHGGLADSMQSGWAEGRTIAGSGQAASSSGSSGLADADNARQQGDGLQPLQRGRAGDGEVAGVAGLGAVGGVDNPSIAGLEGHGRDQAEDGWHAQAGSVAEAGAYDGLGDTDCAGQSARDAKSERATARPAKSTDTGAQSRSRTPDGFWSAPDWLWCRDGKWRPVESGTEPLATGAAARVGRLRAYGNALCAPVATAFVEAFLKCKP